MVENPSSPWFYREGGVVLETQTTPDPVPLLRFNAYAKTWRGEQLSEAEQEALASADAAAPFHNFGGNLCGGDAVLGVIAIHRRDLLEALDKIAEDLGGLGLLGIAVWPTLLDYCQRAASAEAHQQFGDLLLPDPARDTEEEAYVRAWEASPEYAARCVAMKPDDGPDGWSQVPGGEPPEVVMARQAAFDRRYREECGLPPSEDRPTNGGV